MATEKEVKEAMEKQPESSSLESLIRKSAEELGKALPAHMNPERLVRIALTCIRLTPELARCTPASFLGALFTAAQIGLEPIAGRAYILPFNNKRKIGNEWKTFKEAQFLIGYRGLGELFYRHEKALQLSWGKVYKNDEFAYEYGTQEYLRHKPAQNPEGEPIYYYVIAHLQGGAKPFKVMPREDCIEHGKKHSKTYDKKEDKFIDNSPWVRDTDSMCLKTVLIQLAKLLPLSMELQRVIAVDETSRDFRAGIGDALDMPETTNWHEEKENGKESKAIEGEFQEFKPNALPNNPWEIMQIAFKKMKAKIGQEKFFKILGTNGYETPEQIKEIANGNKILAEMEGSDKQ